MPGFDGTGPLGLGPMTGRGMGYCVMPLSQSDGSKVTHGYAGIHGVPVPTTYRYGGNIPYLGGMSPYVPFWRAGFGMRLGRDWVKGFGRGWGRGRGFGRDRSFGRGRWFFGW